MATSKRIICLLFVIGFTTSVFSTLLAQRRISYEQLAQQAREQSVFVDYFTLPGSADNTVQFITTFRVDYNLLPFKKVNNPTRERQFFSTVGMSIEIFKDENPEPEKRRKRNFSVEGLEPAGRASWKDTVYASTYEQTQSKNIFANGKLIVALKPGTYSYILQLTRGEEVEGQTSQKRMIKILPYEQKRLGNIIIVEQSTGSDTDNRKVKLLNFGNNVYYGKDFNAFIHIPDYNPDDEYRLEVKKVDITERDTTQRNTVYNHTLAGEEILKGIHPEIVSGESSLYLALNKKSPGGTYALVNIPNSTFQNDVYQLLVYRENEKMPMARAVFKSRWIEMPTSLLNVDIALEMLQYIVDKETLDRLNEGSSAKKEEKFREFWKKRDPTPKTEFNELMAEYYRRIDYSFEHFSTINVSGFNTDQGKIYIQYGPPDNIERKFPPGEPAVEIWDYGKRRFVFRAISGFGEFELVSK